MLIELNLRHSAADQKSLPTFANLAHINIGHHKGERLCAPKARCRPRIQAQDKAVSLLQGDLTAAKLTP
ncbi:MAG: hypothetical protein EB116_10700 [Betaproteobacteria bacterium]|nr:hypothetical protein [Betaproteobacteria bacterium]